MNASRIFIAGNGTVQPTGPRRLPHQDHTRHAVSFAAIILVLTAIFSLAATAGYAGRNAAAWKAGTHRNNSPGIGALSVDDLPATLNLSPQQRTELASALTDLRQDRSAVGQRLGIGRRARDREDSRPPFEGRRGIRARLHPGDGSRWCDGSGPGDGPNCNDRMDRGGRPGPGDGPNRGPRIDRRNRSGAGMGPEADFEPPMIGFLEKASSILSADQFITLTRHLAERRTEMRPDPADLPAPFEGPFGGLAARRLDLTEPQRDQLKPLLTTFGDGIRQIREDSESGTLTPERARDRAKELRVSLEQGAQKILTPEQWQKVKEFREVRMERASERRTDRQARHVDRITGMYLRALGLKDAQASQVRQIMAATIPARRAVAERRAQEALEPEDFAYQMMTIEKNAAGQVREVLTPDQAKRFDALVDLLPRGLHRGGPAGGPMLDPLGGPPRGPRPGPMRGPDRSPRAVPEGGRRGYR